MLKLTKTNKQKYMTAKFWKARVIYNILHVCNTLDTNYLLNKSQN